MKRIPRIVLAAALVAQVAAAGAQHGEGESSEAVVARPPSPRIVAPAAPSPLPPRAASPAWFLYQEGLRLLEDRRLGEALSAFRKAAESRDELFGEASRAVAEAVASKEAAKAGGSLSALVWLLAERDVIAADRARIKKEAAGSFASELSLLRGRSPSNPLRGLIDATLLVAEEGGLPRVGDSLASLGTVAARLRSYPEAEYRIGQVFLAEGETRLAELQMLRAYDMRDALGDHADGVAMLDSLAGIYRSQGRMKDYEQKLLEIAQQSELFSLRDEHYRGAMERTLSRQGFDKFMALYKVGQAWPSRTYARLGAFYLDAGRRISVVYLAAASNALVTRIVGAIKEDDPGYAYDGLANLASRTLSDGELSGYAEREGLWGSLVLLGEALAETGERASAREIWTVVSRLEGIEPWRGRAQEALGRNPGAKMPYGALDALAP